MCVLYTCLTKSICRKFSIKILLMVLFLPYFGCSRHDAKVLGAYEMELPQVDEE